MEQTIKIFIYVHAFFGGLGLITGLGSVIVKKGGKLHRRMGKLFSVGVITSSLISIPISWMPNHENPFLFLIGLFTIYLVVSGNQILTFKSKDKKQVKLIDKLISGSMLFLSMLMVLYGVFGFVMGSSANILYAFFGAFGLSLSIKDFLFYKNHNKIKNGWLSNHIGKMIGAFIASVTAFIVAGLGVGSLIAWILPSVLGTFYIIYWRKKLKVKTTKVSPI